jgi:hypothetical protein
MFSTILLLILYFVLLKKFKKSLKNYDLIISNRTKNDYFLDYCDEPICFK